nr:DUF2279 domain-containing protein [Flavobacterium aciduliphilum]
MKQVKKFFLFFFLSYGLCQGQSLNLFLKPSDSLNSSRRTTVVVTETALASSALIGLNQLWYAQYPRSKFHTVDDSAEWLQMDKFGHFYSTYHMGAMGYNALAWSGAHEASRLLYGATLGVGFMTVVEVLDGHSSEWGFSWSDMAANVSGASLFVSQQLLWKEQRIVPKFSFHQTSYAAIRPNVLGTSLSQQILKDYNGQTYWFSGNIRSFFKTSKVPTWLNLALGYGAEGMISGKESFNDSASYPVFQRYRQFYLSLDVDFTKIRTKSQVLKTVFALFNSLKVPFPTLELNDKGALKGHLFYY